MEFQNNERVLFAVDASSLLYAARDRFGERSRIDFMKLLNKAKYVSSERPSLFIPIVYLFNGHQGGDKSSLVSYLERIGFCVSVGHYEESLGGRRQSDYRVSEIIKGVDQRLVKSPSNFTRVIFATNQEKILEYIQSLAVNSVYDVRLFSFGGPPFSSRVVHHSLTSDVVFSDVK